MRAGPKGQADLTPLPWAPRLEGAEQFAEFCRAFITTPKGVGARQPMQPRPWQLDLVRTLEGDTKLALWVLGRGNGKSTLVAALALWHVFASGIEGARAVVVAQDERSSMRLLETAARMVELNDDLAARCLVYRDKIVVPATNSAIVALPGEAARIEGEDASLAIADEIGFMRRDAYESLLHSTGKRAESRLVMIGTPSPPGWRDTSPMLDLVLEGRSTPDPSFRLVEYGGDITHPVDCQHCWAAANPGLDDMLSRDHMRSSLPPRSRESEYRRARLAEWVEQDDKAFLAPGVWAGLNTGETIPDGADVVVALDGSYSGDATALLLATVSTTPHFDVLGLWEGEDSTYRVPIVEVEDRIRAACRQYRVVEVVADPYRWARSLQLLAADGIPVVEFNQNPARLTPATADLLQAAQNAEVTHSGDPDLARHVGNATLAEDARGVRLAKEKRSSRRHIDLAACAVMAHSRATWRATHKKKRRRSASF